MKIIQLTKGFSTLVDDSDFETLTQWDWYALFNGRTYYAARGQRIDGKLKCILMHRQIAGAKPGEICDHKNRNSLDNQRGNLRIGTKALNGANSKLRRDNKSGFKGVHFRKELGTWTAFAGDIRIGSFPSAIEAAEAHDKAAVIRYGEFALTNRQLGLLT